MFPNIYPETCTRIIYTVDILCHPPASRPIPSLAEREKRQRRDSSARVFAISSWGAARVCVCVLQRAASEWTYSISSSALKCFR